MLCYVDHHDPAYDLASQRKIETHALTAAAQIVEIPIRSRDSDPPLRPK